MDLDELPEMLRVEKAAALLRIGRTAAYESGTQFRDTSGRDGIPKRAHRPEPAGAEASAGGLARRSAVGVARCDLRRRRRRADPDRRPSSDALIPLTTRDATQSRNLISDHPLDRSTSPITDATTNSGETYEGLRPHDLRHTAISLWIAADASPKDIPRRAGHASVATVLDRYGHLLPGTEEKVNDALDRIAGGIASTEIARARTGSSFRAETGIKP